MPEPEKLGLDFLAVENLRGFSKTRIDLDQTTVFLVGPNNSGKTSLLSLLDTFFNWDLDAEFERVTDELLVRLLPARETRNAARRLTLGIRVQDGRRHQALKCKGGLAHLRLSLTLNDRRLRANLGSPRRGEKHDQKAKSLIDELRSEYAFEHVPAGRSADSRLFTQSLLDAVTESLLATLKQPGPGATKAERDAKKVMASLEKLAGPVDEFWGDFLDRLPSGWIQRGTALPSINHEVLSGFIAEQLVLSLTTGRHDESGVPPAEVGSGLQSLLDLELRRAMAEVEGRRMVVAVEEPEVFLHPSAQRQLGRRLSEGNQEGKTVVSTHSPLILEEADWSQVAVVREHAVSQPSIADADRAAINTGLIAGRGAEVFFSRSVLLVEGPGDREYWEVLRRRLAHSDESGAVDHLYVLEVGSNTQFGPWLRLFRSYPSTPFRWLLLMDADSPTELRQAISHASLRLSDRQRDAINVLRSSRDTDDLTGVESGAADLAEIEPGESRILLAPGDLESMICSGLSENTAASICDEIGFEELTGPGLAERLGTKHRTGGSAIANPRKSPWMRSVVARQTPVDELTPFVQTVLQTWLGGAVDKAIANATVQSFVNGT